MIDKYKILALCLLFLQCITAFQKAEAVTANPNTVQYTQPDGSTITLHMKGDEFIHWATTLDGYMVMSSKSGAYEYAKIMPDGRLGFSDVPAHDPGQRTTSETGFIKSIRPGLFFSKEQLGEMRNYLSGHHSPSASIAGTYPTTGVCAHLMILANFSNTTTTYTQTQFTNLMNQVNYNSTGSFKDYYLEVSYGLLTVNSTVTVWVTLPHTHDYYGPQSMWGTFAYDAVVAADQQAGVNYALYDNNADGIVDGVCIAHQGRGQEESGNINDIWSHSWDLAQAGYSVAQRTFDGVQVLDYTTIPEKGSASTMTTIGVMCHEFGHNLGTMDFYDTDYNTGGQYDGSGDWDIMADGSWNGSPAGSRPAHHNPWTKIFYNWVTPTVLTAQQSVLVRNYQTYPDIFQYNTSTANEYFLCVNYQKTGFNTDIPGHGMLVFHVDGNYISLHETSNDINAGSHQGFYPMSATSTTASGIMPSSSSTINTGGCPWPGTSNKTTFTDATTPNSKSWSGTNTAKPLINIAENNTTKEVTFCFIACPDLNDPTNFTATPVSSTQINLGWVNNANNNPVMVAYNLTGVFGTPVNGTPYTAGSTITGGGGVLYVGANSSINHTGLTPNTTYYYKAWSVMTGNTYSSGVTANATTFSSPTFSVTPSNQNVPATPAGSTAFSVTSSSSWTVVSDQPWCTVNPSGTGNGTITANYTVNSQTSSRVANITTTVAGISPVVVTVTQAGESPTLSVTPANQNVPAIAGQTSFTVTSNSNWTVVSDQSWCTPTSSGTGNGVITGNYLENPTVQTRIASLTVTVAGLTPVIVTMTQAGQAPTLSVTPPNQNVSIASGSVNFSVTSNSNWTVISDQLWCVPTTSGTGNGIITADYLENSSSASRIATLTVTVSGLTPVTVTVQQEGTEGMNEISDEDIIIIPNPSDGLFNVRDKNGLSHSLAISIFDISGKTYISDEYTGSCTYEFDLRKFARGEYFIRIKSGSKVMIRKLVIK